MKKLLLVTTLALLSYGSAFADGGASADLGREQGLAPSTIETAPALSRSAVIAALQRARASGELEALTSEVDGPRPFIDSAVSTKTRAQVLAELQAARANGELELLNSDSADFAAFGTAQQRGKAVATRLAGQVRSAQQ